MECWNRKIYLIVMTIGLKDRTWEVKETLLPREDESASERHLRPQAMQKKALKPTPHPDSQDHYHQFPGSPVFPTMQDGEKYSE
jgi:hypothetical protein